MNGDVTPRRILVADDNRDAADSLVKLLRLCGHETSVAYNGVDALDVATRTNPEIVFLDIAMPGLNGYELARRLRAQSNGRRITLVALTGFGQHEDKRLAGESGFDHHLTKPADLAIIESVIAAH
jgi:CheY-like chemotaxis protein